MRDIVGEIKERARKRDKVIVLPETWDPRILRAAAIIRDEGFTHVELIGKPDEIRLLAREIHANIGDTPIRDPEETVEQLGLVDKLVELRKHKGLTPDKAAQMLQDNLYVAAMLVKENKAHGYVAGAANSTANVMRSALRVLKTKPGIRTVSSSFLMVVPQCEYGADGVFIFADCGVVPNPTAEQLADIAFASAASCRNLIGVAPIVGMLSFSTKGSGKDPTVDKVIEATKILKERAPDLIVDGSLQADAALVPAVAERKAPDSPVAGRANTLIFPDLNAGNICYKMTHRLAKAGAYGPLIQGCGRPVNDLSRGCSVEDIITVVAINAVTE